MTEQNNTEEHVPVLGQPEKEPDPYADTDFAREHEETAVASEILTGEDDDRESEQPRGWSGMQR